MKHHINIIQGFLIKDKLPYCARYKNRIPDPGECKVISINWEEGRVELTNGACRYYPSFEEIEIYNDPHPLIAMMKKIDDVLDAMTPEELRERFCKPEITTREAVERLGTIRGHKYLDEDLFQKHQYLTSRLEDEGELIVEWLYGYHFVKQEYEELFQKAFSKQIRSN